jgi:hypothetical protein
MKRKTTGEGYKRKPKRGSMKTNENLWKSWRLRMTSTDVNNKLLIIIYE